MNKQNEIVYFSAATEYPKSTMTFEPLLNDEPELDFNPYIFAEA